MAKQTDLVQWLPLSGLRLDPRINRNVDTARVKRYVRDFDADAIGVIQVSVRGNGNGNGRGLSNGTFIVDGQHRTLAMMEMGWGDQGQKIPCMVHRGLTLQQEADLFLKLNNYRLMNHTEKFMKRVVAKDPTALLISALVREQGWKISAQVGDGQIPATASLEKVYSNTRLAAGNAHPDELRAVLETIHAAWGNAKEGLKGDIIQGLGSIFLRDGHLIDRKRLVAKLSKYAGGANGIVGAARGFRQIHSMPIARAVAAVIRAEYNKGARTKLLPGWTE